MSECNHGDDANMNMLCSTINTLHTQIRQLTERAEKAERERDHWMTACKSDAAKMFEAMQERDALAEKLLVATEALEKLDDGEYGFIVYEALSKIRGNNTKE